MKLSSYTLGYAKDLKSLLAIRMERQKETFKEIRTKFGQSITDIDFFAFGVIEFLERKGNNFGRAFYLTDAQGKLTQIYAQDKTQENSYVLLSVVAARAISGFMESADEKWPQLLVFEIEKESDVRYLMTKLGLISDSKIILI